MKLRSIKSGPTEIVASGSFIPFQNSPTELTLGDARNRMRLIISFSESSEKKEPHDKKQVVDKQTLKLELVNFNNPLGTGNIQPLKIGEFDKRQLYLQLKVYHQPKGDKLVHYTIYRDEGEREDG